jgi:c-di-GMP-binding flagellar brake protein YcgR
MEERRTTTRVEVPLIGTITVEGKEPIKVYAKDISPDGAYLVGMTSPCVGDQVRINLKSSSEFHQFKFSLKAFGIVMRVDPPEERKYGFAVNFEQILD